MASLFKSASAVFTVFPTVHILHTSPKQTNYLSPGFLNKLVTRGKSEDIKGPSSLHLVQKNGKKIYSSPFLCLKSNRAEQPSNGSVVQRIPINLFLGN